MWDVKFLCTNVFTVCVEVFYLNYVGCKVVSLEKLISFWVEFYLNYVGCKGVWMLNSLVRLRMVLSELCGM